MDNELFDSISALLGTSGATVSSKTDGTITVTVPDSDEILAECRDNGDGTLSYTMHLGGGTEETGNGTPEDFKEHVLDALDTWISEPVGIVTESCRSDMRNSLYEMGLDDDQADAIMETVGILCESSLVTVTIGGKPVTGSSIRDIATRKENRSFLKRQWVLSQYKKLGKTPSGKLLPTDDLIEELGIQPPTNDELVDFVKGYMDTMQEERLHTDDEILGTAWNKFGKSDREMERSSLTASRTGDADKSDAAMSNESDIESGEKDDYDDELGFKKARLIRGEDDEVAPASEEDVSEQYGIDLKEHSAEDVSGEMNIESLWDGDASVLGQVDADSEYDIPVNTVERITRMTDEMKSSFGDIMSAIPAFGTSPTGFILRMMFGRPGAGLGGAVLNLIKGSQEMLGKIESGNGILDASKATPGQRNDLNGALSTKVVKSAIGRVQDKFAEIAKLIENSIPDAYDEARNVEPDSVESANGRIDEVSPDFVNLFRTILYDRGVPFAAYPWSVVKKLCTKLNDVMKLGKPVTAERHVTAAPAGAKVTA